MEVVCCSDLTLAVIIIVMDFQMSVKKKTKELAAAEAAGKWELVGDLLSEVGTCFETPA